MNTRERIRVMLVDDHSMVRRGLATFMRVKQDLVLVGEVGDGAEALALCGRLRPDVILMDLLTRGEDRVTPIREIQERFPDIQVIVLTGFEEVSLVQQALEAGALSYLLKNVSAHELAETIRAACAARATFAPEAVTTYHV
ncbi:MAG: response regulator transcription factor [Chloroflexota bacterium]|nr:response regulator transcription factor [Chloroflexota bacterium]